MIGRASPAVEGLLAFFFKFCIVPKFECTTITLAIYCELVCNNPVVEYVTNGKIEGIDALTGEKRWLSKKISDI